MPQKWGKLDANLKVEAQLAATDKQVGNELAPLKRERYFVCFRELVAAKSTATTQLGHFTQAGLRYNTARSFT